MAGCLDSPAVKVKLLEMWPTRRRNRSSFQKELAAIVGMFEFLLIIVTRVTRHGPMVDPDLTNFSTRTPTIETQKRDLLQKFK